MSNLRRLEQLEKHPQMRAAVHAQHLLALLQDGKLDVTQLTDEELSTIVNLPCDDGLDVTQLTDNELQALIDSEEKKSQGMN